jgi:hypothetical protein
MSDGLHGDTGRGVCMQRCLCNSFSSKKGRDDITRTGTLGQ